MNARLTIMNATRMQTASIPLACIPVSVNLVTKGAELCVNVSTFAYLNFEIIL